VTTPTLLVVDDDATLVALLTDYLGLQGFEVIGVTDGERAVEVVRDTAVDLVLLDVMMPRVDGWSVCQRLGAEAPPVIMVTARGEEMDKLRGFRLGVDDYVTKPFSFAELAARIRAVLARTSAPPVAADVPVVTVDPARREALVHGTPVELTPTEYRLLEHLCRHGGRPVSGRDLVVATWGSAVGYHPGQLKRVVWALRRKIEEDPGNPRLLRTVRGFGYRLGD
jgi:DNA-binding response OmpR family regulator